MPPYCFCFSALVPYSRKKNQLLPSIASYGSNLFSNNHINGEEIAAVRRYTGKQLVLLPGVGDQGGEAEAIWRHYNLDAVIVNVGRELMFPQGSSSTREDHQAAAKQYQEMLNALRGV